MTQTILARFDFDDEVVQHKRTRESIEDNIVQLIRYQVSEDEKHISLDELPEGE